NEIAKQVEDVKVQPASPPPALSLSPIPLARQPADVAKPIASKPGKSDTAKSDTVKSDEAKPEAAKTAAKSSRDAKRVAREAASQPMRIMPDAKPANDPAPSSVHRAKRRKSARAKPRRSEPDLPRVLRKMFE
ncbi:MAG: hypothetical protein J0H75_01365, partial [Rhizobiales bacterium]|nr:hypothetical protein [Hyphomicrobiales bacterium]